MNTILFSEETMRFKQQGAVPWKIFCFLSYSLSLSYYLCCSFSPLIQSPHVPVAVCLKYLENPFGFCRLQRNSLAKGGLLVSLNSSPHVWQPSD